MSKSKRPTAREELQRIEDALLDSLLNVSGDEVRGETAAAGIDPDSRIAEVDATIAAARSAYVRNRFDSARAELAAWRRRIVKANTMALDAARAKFDKIWAEDSELPERTLLAARKGEGLSDSDMEGLFEDLATLEELERADEDE